MNLTSQVPVDLPIALTIAGSDSGGGAGIQTDLLTFATLGIHGTSAITCLTAQNPDGVSGVFPVSPEFVLEQARQVAAFFPLSAIKTGMLFSEKIIQAVCGFLDESPDIPLVVDPVMVATSGAILLQPEAVRALQDNLFPRATLITPNLDEVRVLLGAERKKETPARDSGLRLRDAFGCSVLIKGGHGRGDRVIDTLIPLADEPVVFDYPRIHTINTHGGGCTLAAAIAALLAQRRPLLSAVQKARDFLQESMNRPKRLCGHNFIRPCGK